MTDVPLRDFVDQRISDLEKLIRLEVHRLDEKAEAAAEAAKEAAALASRRTGLVIASVGAIAATLSTAFVLVALLTR